MIIPPHKQTTRNPLFALEPSFADRSLRSRIVTIIRVFWAHLSEIEFDSGLLEYNSGMCLTSISSNRDEK